MGNRLDHIRLRAHELWEQEGRPHGREEEHWRQAEREFDAQATPSAPAQANEGEGNRTAAHRYNQGTKDFIESGQVDEKAREAAKAVSGPEGEELRQAEETAKRRGQAKEPARRRAS
jgi:hypothetical protein